MYDLDWWVNPVLFQVLGTVLTCMIGRRIMVISVLQHLEREKAKRFQGKGLFFYMEGASKVYLSPHPCPTGSNLITYPYQATKEDMKWGLQWGIHTCWFFRDVWLFTFKDHSRFHSTLSTHFVFFCVLGMIEWHKKQPSFTDRDYFRRNLTNASTYPRHPRTHFEHFDK